MLLIDQKRQSRQSDGQESALYAQTKQTSEMFTTSKESKSLQGRVPPSGYVNSTQSCHTQQKSVCLKPEGPAYSYIVESQLEDDKTSSMSSPHHSVRQVGSHMITGDRQILYHDRNTAAELDVRKGSIQPFSNLQLDSMLDSKLSMGSANQKDLVDVRMRIQKLMGGSLASGTSGTPQDARGDNNVQVDASSGSMRLAQYLDRQND